MSWEESVKEWDISLLKDKELLLLDLKNRNLETNPFQIEWHMLMKNKTRMLKMW